MNLRVIMLLCFIFDCENKSIIEETVAAFCNKHGFKKQHPDKDESSE